MAKPIVVVTVPTFTNQDEYNEFLDSLEKKLYDYHVFVLRGDVQSPTVKVFPDTFFNEEEHGKLKQHIIETQTNV